MLLAECCLRSAACGVLRAECCLRSAACGVLLAECCVRSAACGVPRVECRVWSAACGVPRAECRALRAEGCVLSTACGVLRAECRARSAACRRPSAARGAPRSEWGVPSAECGSEGCGTRPSSSSRKLSIHVRSTRAAIEPMPNSPGSLAECPRNHRAVSAGARAELSEFYSLDSSASVEPRRVAHCASNVRGIQSRARFVIRSTLFF